MERLTTNWAYRALNILRRHTTAPTAPLAAAVEWVAEEAEEKKLRAAARA